MYPSERTPDDTCKPGGKRDGRRSHAAKQPETHERPNNSTETSAILAQNEPRSSRDDRARGPYSAARRPFTKDGR